MHQATNFTNEPNHFSHRETNRVNEQLETLTQTPPRDEILEHVSCAVCGSGGHDVVFEARYENERDLDLIQKFRASGDELLIDRLVRCRDCGLQYISPRLRSDLILASYAEGEDPVYVSQMQARERTFAACLARIERVVGRPGTLLDIGTAAGGFLAAANARGWKAEGCEPNLWLAAWGARHYGVRIRPGNVFEQPYEPASFDVVTLWDVIEHTTNPREMIEHCRTLLKPGGILVVNYPDIGSWIARALGRRWLFLTSVHLHYFDRRTMARLLQSTGFDVTLVRPHVQRLELDYLLSRAAVLSQTAAGLARRVVASFGVGRKQVPYWLGQTFVAARRLNALLLAFGPGVHELAEVLVLL
jgi:2-polyprenyl-3-methyl-5-hydroxy-6-metoxy-1,4-benzoquinol methylase